VIDNDHRVTNAAQLTTSPHPTGADCSRAVVSGTTGASDVHHQPSTTTTQQQQQ